MSEKINENKTYTKKEINKINNPKKPLILNMNQPSNTNSNNQIISPKNTKNQELAGIENILKNAIQI